MANVLPPGFDPTTGRINIPSSMRSRPRPRPQTQTYTAYDDRGIVQRIGDWFSDKAEDMAMYVLIGVIALMVIGLLYAVGMQFYEGHIFYGILALILGGTALYYTAYILGMVVYGAVYIIFKVLRCIFYNVWTLIATILLAAGLTVGTSYNRATTSSTNTRQEVVSTTPYVCTTAVLNVRSGPGKSYSKIGKIKKGETINVIDIQGSFAHFKYQGRNAYVSTDYIQRR